MATIIEKNKMLFIQDDWQISYTEPERYRQNWPTGVFSRDYSYIIGKEAIYWQSGLYNIMGTGSGIKQIRLENLGECKAAWVDVEPIKKPKWAKSWSQGQWRRY
jgi:hypothetical protein